MSGGTLIALAADEIVMCTHSVLGPIDPQLGQSPAASLIKVIEQKTDRRDRSGTPVSLENYALDKLHLMGLLLIR
jgi:ClpP class serine protease